MVRKFLWILGLLVISNVAIYFWGEARLRAVRDNSDRLLEASARIARERQDEVGRLQGEVDRLKAWGYLVDFQEKLALIDSEIENLNYGNALEMLDDLEAQIFRGEMGSLLASSAAALEPGFESVRGELQGMSGNAADRLRELGRSAFEALSGFSAEVEEGAKVEDGEVDSSESSSSSLNPEPSSEEPAEDSREIENSDLE